MKLSDVTQGATTRRAFLSSVGVGGLATLGNTVGAASNSPEALGGSRSEIESRHDESSEFDKNFDADVIENYFDKEMDQRIGEETPGAVVAVVKSDETVFVSGYGSADVESGAPVQADETGFRNGSVSKLVTYTAVMQGVERGVLDLDTDVNQYLDESAVEIPDTYDEPVTLRHLGTHTAGFDAIANPGMTTSHEEITSLETALVENQRERVRPPGEVTAYSNYSTMLAGHIVAQAHDTTFREYVDSEIFDPLDMDHSVFVQPVPEGYPGNLASPHTSDANGFAVADRSFINWRPAGAMTSTATDMACFMRAHLNGGQVDESRVLEDETVEEMHGTQFKRNPAVNNMAYGFFEEGAPEESLLGHSGATLYFLSELVLIPEDDVGIFVSYNSGPGPNTEMPRSLVEQFVQDFGLGFAAYSPGSTNESDENESTAGWDAKARTERVAGEYRTTIKYESGLGEALTRTVNILVAQVDDNRLVISTPQKGDREFIETAPYVYREVEGHDAFVFEIKDNNIIRAHRSGSAVETFEPATFSERQAVAGGGTGLAVGGFVLLALGWGVGSVWRRWRGHNDSTKEESP